MTPIERIAPPSADEFERRYIKASRPVILRGAIDDWPAMRKWTPGYFRDRFGDRVVPAARKKNGAIYDAKTGVNYEPVKFRDYLDSIEGASPLDLYMIFRTHEHAPELLDDVVRPIYTRRSPWYRSRFWLAPPRTKGPLHRDLPQNLYAQISGRKEFVMLDRRETRRVHRYPFYSGVPNYSPVDAFEPDLERHPRFRGAPLLLAALEPGDLFFIPSLWWHQARSIDTSLSVNLWWTDSRPMFAAVRAAELFMNVRKLSL